ncbi:endonuclease [Niveispirillum fermenti]|uniref:endonuclease n=1 Tax=Niveispirillum fermenti TaxID=1233113 RepID=UPI003A8B354F
MFRQAVFGFLVLFLGAFPAGGEQPARPLANFDKAKVVARDSIYADRRIDYYCSCSYTPKNASGGVIDKASCGLVSSSSIATRLDWEHVVPAWFFGNKRSCWAKVGCKPGVEGRECCERTDPEFKQVEADLHNLVPSVALLNVVRSNHAYGMVEGDPRKYGRCEFEIGGNPKRVEPPQSVRGDLARVWLYMIDTYGVEVTEADLAVLKLWSLADPVDEWERLRDRRIEAAQGNFNPYVRNAAP